MNAAKLAKIFIMAIGGVKKMGDSWSFKFF
jgi:hypothetical protein